MAILAVAGVLHNMLFVKLRVPNMSPITSLAWATFFSAAACTLCYVAGYGLGRLVT
jgi:hypothetical protein